MTSAKRRFTRVSTIGRITITTAFTVDVLVHGPEIKVGRDHLENHEAKRARKLQLLRNRGRK